MGEGYVLYAHLVELVQILKGADRIAVLDAEDHDPLALLLQAIDIVSGVGYLGLVAVERDIVLPALELVVAPVVGGIQGFLVLPRALVQVDGEESPVLAAAPHQLETYLAFRHGIVAVRMEGIGWSVYVGVKGYGNLVYTVCKSHVLGIGKVEGSALFAFSAMFLSLCSAYRQQRQSCD